MHVTVLVLRAFRHNIPYPTYPMTPTQEGTTTQGNTTSCIEMQSGTSTPMQEDSDAISIAAAAQENDTRGVDHSVVCDTRVPFLHPMPHLAIFYRLFPVLTRTPYSMTPTQEEGGTIMEENAAPSMEMQSGTSTPMQGDSDAISIAAAAQENDARGVDQVDHSAVCDTRVPFLHPMPHPVILYRLCSSCVDAYALLNDTHAGGGWYNYGGKCRTVNGDAEWYVNADARGQRCYPHRRSSASGPPSGMRHPCAISAPNAPPCDFVPFVFPVC